MDALPWMHCRGSISSCSSASDASECEFESELELEDKKAELRNKEREIQDLEEKHQVQRNPPSDMQLFKQS